MAVEILLPASNPEGIPDLSLTGPVPGPGPTLPVVQWGSFRRTRGVVGGATLCFYTDDYRFTRIWAQPDLVVRARPAAAVEPNYSLSDASPHAAVLWATYRKRWLGAYWQSQGLPLWVDVGVPVSTLAHSLLGVPQGWRHYATRAYSPARQPGAETELRAQLAAAAERALPHTPILIVVGGGAGARELCRELPGTIWAGELAAERCRSRP